MKKPNITPGEWRDVTGNGEFVHSKNRNFEYTICQFFSKHETDFLNGKENAQLVCKAGNLTNSGYNIESIPELIEALVKLNTELDYFWNSRRSEARVKNINKAQQQCLEALKKAKFES